MGPAQRDYKAFLFSTCSHATRIFSPRPVQSDDRKVRLSFHATSILVSNAEEHRLLFSESFFKRRCIKEVNHTTNYDNEYLKQT